MKLELCGYFDHNFGDDYIQKIAAHYMPEHTFFVNRLHSPSPLLLAEKNVHLMREEHHEMLPKLLVTGCGFMVNSLEALKCEIVWYLRSEHIADFCIGCNIEPFHDILSEWLVARKLEKFRYIVCRDKKSFAWIQKHCPKTESRYMPDILFGMPKEWLPSAAGGESLGISLFNNGSENVEYCRKMAEIADYWVEKTGKNVILLAFDVGMENDPAACEKVKSQMQYADSARIVKHGALGEIPNAFAECRKIIGARFHSCVLSMKMHIDFYPILYRQKIRNLISDTAYPIGGCDIDSIDLEDIKTFLDTDKVDFSFDERYEDMVRNGFDMLKCKMQKE